MLRIWGREDLLSVQKVMWCVRELGIPFEQINAGRHHGIINEPWYLQMNPNGTIPTIDDDGFVLWESNAILKYLCAKHSAGKFSPTDPLEYADADRWISWQRTTLWPPMREILLGLVRTDPGKRDHKRLAALISAVTKHWQVLDGRLQGRRYIMGDRFTMADIALRPARLSLVYLSDRSTGSAPSRELVSEIARATALQSAFYGGRRCDRIQARMMIVCTRKSRLKRIAFTYSRWRDHPIAERGSKR